ncbi:MAG: hypothetical protein ACLVB1_03040 [Blautia obeum]
MQEWMIAMLVISIMLIIRDMAKTIQKICRIQEELPSLQEGHPQKERVEKYAASFQKLADTFYGMPYRKDYLSSRQVEQIIEDTNAKVCTDAIRGKSAGRTQSGTGERSGGTGTFHGEWKRGKCQRHPR